MPIWLLWKIWNCVRTWVYYRLGYPSNGWHTNVENDWRWDTYRTCVQCIIHCRFAAYPSLPHSTCPKTATASGPSEGWCRTIPAVHVRSARASLQPATCCRARRYCPSHGDDRQDGLDDGRGGQRGVRLPFVLHRPIPVVWDAPDDSVRMTVVAHQRAHDRIELRVHGQQPVMASELLAHRFAGHRALAAADGAHVYSRSPANTRPQQTDPVNVLQIHCTYFHIYIYIQTHIFSHFPRGVSTLFFLWPICVDVTRI